MASSNPTKIPVTLITGYLGAGKTTLLKRIIDYAVDGNTRIAIVMNEFGEIAIDSRIIEGRNVKIAELAGGCVCCSLSGEFNEAVRELCATVEPEWIVVETTGAAEPSALAYDIANSMEGVRLDAVVTVVDADALIRFPAMGHTGREQIELADLLIVNKTDLVRAEERQGLAARIAAMNGRAEIIETVRCDVDPAAMFGMMRDQIEKKPHAHRIEFECFEYVADRRLDHDRFIALIGRLKDMKEIYRAKGFVVTDQGRFLLNYVAGRHSLEPFACSRTELVFIGKGAGNQRKCMTDALDEIRK